MSRRPIRDPSRTTIAPPRAFKRENQSKTLPQPRETLILSACLQWLGFRGVLCWRQNAGGTYRGTFKSGKPRYVNNVSVPGISDIVGVLPGGRFLAVEVKSAKGRLRPEQKVFLDDVRRAGGLALVVRSVEELAAAIDEDMGRLVWTPVTEKP